VVLGAVQGVGFRYFVLHRAREAGLRGWVRNCADGSVECVAEGARPALERLLAELGEGPRQARVAEVKADWQPPRGDLRSFDLRT
jgi:acylphosphatase